MVEEVGERAELFFEEEVVALVLVDVALEM